MHVCVCERACVYACVSTCACPNGVVLVPKYENPCSEHEKAHRITTLQTGCQKGYINSDIFKPLGAMVSSLEIQNFSRFFGSIGSVLSMKIISTSFSIEVWPGNSKCAWTSFCM